MRSGFTTGSCAAAAAKAAAARLLLGFEQKTITIRTPKGILYEPEVRLIQASGQSVCCAVRKDGGDDPDVTSGYWIHATVSFCGSDDLIVIDGGPGVGRVTRPGLDQPVGNAAINHVPREMITQEVKEICTLADFHGGLSVVISVPGGEELAAHTFNPRLGIVGGISIIGTSGIVEPMSNQALVDTIRVELSQRKAMGYSYVAITPGNYGRDFMRKCYGYDIDRSVRCSNFIGKTLDYCIELGFEKVLLTGHIGKLVKVSGGIMNTHSGEGDCRMELLTAAGLMEGLSAEKACRLLECLVTEEALRILKDEGILMPTMTKIMEKIMYYLRKRADGRIQVECVIYSNDFGELARSEGAKEWLTLLAQEQEPRT